MNATSESLEPLARLQLALSVAHAANEEAVARIERLLHPDIHLASVPGVAPGRGFDGVKGVRRYFREARKMGFLAQAAITRAQVTDGGNVLAEGRLVCTIDGVPDSVGAFFVYGFRDGLVSAIETCTDRDLAWERALDSTLGQAPEG